MTLPMLSDGERREIDVWAHAHVVDWADYPRWQVHFRMWDWFVHALGDDKYRGGVDDYCYYLFLRSQLTPLISAAPSELSKRLTAWMNERDHLLREATEEDAHDVLSQYHTGGPGWWWRRIPRSGALAAQLRKDDRRDAL
jgi:hypothetical protein